jgi:mutator protein MutT
MEVVFNELAVREMNDAIAYYECVSFILINDGKVLLEKRRDDREIDPGLIMIPGGHIEDGETEQQALERELLEELGVKATRTDYVCTLIHTTREIQKIHYYLIRSWQGEIKTFEAESLFWHSVTDSTRLDIVPDRVALAEYLRLYT